MRHYGDQLIGSIAMLRYEGVTNQFAYSLPLSYSNSTFRTRTDIMYLCEESGPITVVECQTNPSLVGLTLQGGNTYIPEELFGNNIVKLESGNTLPIFTMIFSNRLSNSFILNVNTVPVDGTYTIPSNTYAAIVEGTLTISNTTVDSNNDLYIIGKRDDEQVVSGQCKLITFELT